MYPVPRNEARRLAELHDRALLDDTPEPAFERIVRLAARHFAMPMAAITFVDEHRVWLRAKHGLKMQDAAREDSICAHAIMLREVFVVPDVRADRRFGCAVPGAGEDEVRFYAGAPLWTADGCALGALCVMDTAPREFDREEKEMLADLAVVVMNELERRRLAVRLADERRRGRQSRRTLVRQDQLLQRLNASHEELVRLRVAELTRLHESSRARADAVLQADKEEAEKANTAKSEFLLRMSHELRTPLNAILGFGQILQGAVGAEDRRMSATHVVMAGRHLLSLINEVLDIARIESGRLELSLESVGVQALVGETLDLVRPLAAERRIALETRAPVDAGGRAVAADRQRLKQVLLNFLSNAIKYSPEASRVVVHWREERGRMLRLCVSDDGPGIAREQAARLFVAFERLGAEGSDVPGTGLGLALSKRLVEAMRGRIGARVGAGRGSTFWVRLPLWPETDHPLVPVRPILPVT